MSNIGKQVGSIMATLDGQNFDLGYSKGWEAGVKWAREQIAKEIFALKTDEGRKTPWNPLTPNIERVAWGSGYAEARNQAGFIARGKDD